MPDPQDPNLTNQPKPTFELAPEPPAPPPPPPAPKPTISAPGLTEGFDEDADFETDPEVERALGKRPDAARGAEAPPAVEPFIRVGLGDPQVIALIGAGVLLSAVIAAAITAPSLWWVHGMLAAYAGLLHAGTGVGALAIGARLAEKPLGPWELGAARMLLAVALFQLVFHIPLPAQIWLGPVVAAAVYAGATMTLFRLPVQQWFTVAASHLGIWMVIEGLVWLNTLLVPIVARSPGVAGP
ncbi:MAG: hypothetical protein IT436_06870 [Phycisphaerales bacterium]|nr:hypothetical protein [Phycisphaerales bacterium]